MKLEIVDAEVFGRTESSISLAFRVETEAGETVDAPVEVRVGDELRTRSEAAGARVVRIEGLEPSTGYRLDLSARGAEGPRPDRYWHGSVSTLAAPEADQVASFATLNDLHFGEEVVGGTLLSNGDYGPVAEGFPAFRASDTEIPYWRFMNEDAVSEINTAAVDATLVKGDIADRGRPEQFAAAADCFAKLDSPWHAFLGNHDHYGRLDGLDVDGCALLGQPAAPRGIDLGGWRILLIDTVVPGHHHGALDGERLAWIAGELDATRETGIPTLMLMHHHPVPPRYRDQYPNTIGLEPADSLRLFRLVGDNPQVRGVLIGHTHRNRVRRHADAGDTPFAEVQCTKDYPGGWAHYRLFADGSFRQEVRRTASERALAHSANCRHLFRGFYRDFALGPLDARSFVVGPL